MQKTGDILNDRRFKITKKQLFFVFSATRIQGRIILLVFNADSGYGFSFLQNAFFENSLKNGFK